MALRTRQQFAAIDEGRGRQNPTLFDSPWLDYRGALHVHTRAGGHTQGTLEEMLDAARRVGLDFVALTEHPKASTSGWPAVPGTPSAPLLIRGQELDGPNSRRLVLEGGNETGFCIATHWTSSVDCPAVEIFNLHEEAENTGYVRLALSWLGAGSRYGQYLLMPHVSAFREHLRQWDRMTAQQPLVALAGNDAHANVGLRFGRQALLLDPYHRSFGYVSTHIWLERSTALTVKSVLQALRRGHCYVAFDFLGPTRTFYFGAARAEGQPAEILAGDQVRGPVQLRARSPLRARIVLVKDGQTLQETDSLGLDFTTSQPGVYRVELYLRQLGSYAETHPWILSNPIYVK